MGLQGAVGQCSTCSLRQRRGGTLLQATLGCRAFEAEQPERTGALLATVAVDLAREGRCPVCMPLVNEPDSYLAEDLPLHGAES